MKNPPSSTMQAILMQGTGGPEVMEISTFPVPIRKNDEILIQVMAAGINRPDIAQRQGNYPPPKDANPNLGLEIAGRVIEAPPASPFQPGDKICALTNGGGYAEYCTVPFTQCLPWPKGFNAYEAASLPETFFTVWVNLFEIGQLQKGDHILIHGGAGGIGTTAIQLAHAFGATVYTTVSSDEKGEYCKKLGAMEYINYNKYQFPEKIAELTNKKGVTLILDIMGASYLEQNLKSLSEDGKLIIISFQGGIQADNVNLARIVTKRLTLTGSTLRPRSAKFKGQIAHALHQHVWPLLEQGTVKPQLYRVLPFRQVQAAHQIMENSHHTGKLVLDFSAGS